jgi:hypothetical protein
MRINGVADCNVARAEREAQMSCASSQQMVARQYASNPCTAWFGNGRNYRLVGQIQTRFNNGGGFAAQVAGRSRTFSQSYQCCVRVGSGQGGRRRDQ